MSQLRIDLRRRIYDKLMQWNLDAFNLYEMAELPDEAALEDAYTVLLNLVIAASPTMGMDADKLCYVVRKAFAEREHMQSH